MKFQQLDIDQVYNILRAPLEAPYSTRDPFLNGLYKFQKHPEQRSFNPSRDIIMILFPLWV